MKRRNSFWPINGPVCSPKSFPIPGLWRSVSSSRSFSTHERMHAQATSLLHAALTSRPKRPYLCTAFVIATRLAGGLSFVIGPEELSTKPPPGASLEQYSRTRYSILRSLPRASNATGMLPMSAILSGWVSNASQGGFRIFGSSLQSRACLGHEASDAPEFQPPLILGPPGLLRCKPG